ncbi:hypothetical protein M9Y10_030765 [Tritrichomonas musculus]|uniref:DUF3447 domain-containing protein n=1 Tax=Tritrichomonas musculus TaxID=1915356 RepID=A0ABR2H3T1_9EUKA
MEIKKLVDEKKDIYEYLMIFVEITNFEKFDFNDLIKFISKYLKTQEEFNQFLLLILHIFNNHHRQPNFLNKIFQILRSLSKEIKQLLSNQEIFDIFKSNKLILLFLFENQIISFDEYILNYITFSLEAKRANLIQFFLPEIKKIKEKYENDIKYKLDYDNFEENRHIGENESYICQLIRDDSVEEFITYTQKTNFSLSNTKIKQSIFESNSFLNENTPTLIEYAAFFGSVQIFQYLRLNGAEITESLWLYAIHSNNADLIHLLEELGIKPADETYEECLLESIKCHHNDISRYIEDNLLVRNVKTEGKLKEDIISCSFCYSNYKYFPYEFDKYYAFLYLDRYNHSKLVNIFIENEKKKVERIKIFNFFFFNQIPD